MTRSTPPDHFDRLYRTSADPLQIVAPKDKPTARSAAASISPRTTDGCRKRAI